MNIISSSITPQSMQRLTLQASPNPSMPAEADDAQAQRAADRASQQAGHALLARRSRQAPDLPSPMAAPLGMPQLRALLPQMAGQHPAMVPGATAEAFVALHRLAAQATAGEAAGEADMRQVMAQAQTLIGLISPDGQLAYPTATQLRALAGLDGNVPDALRFADELLGDAPGMREVLEEASATRAEELPIRMQADDRMAYILMLVAVLMRMNAGQREQAAAMVNLAAQSVQAMAESTVSSAKAAQVAKIVTLSVGVATAGAGLTLGAVAMTKGVSSLRANKAGAETASIDGNQLNHANAVGMNTAHPGAAATPPQVATLRAEPQIVQEIATTSSTAHAIDTTKLGVLTSASHAVVQTSNGAGAVAGSPFDLEAAGHSVDAEKDRLNKDVELDVSGQIKQQVSKTSEEERAMFTLYANRGQDKKQAADHIIGNMKR